MDTKFKKGRIPWNKGKKMRPETFEKLRKTLFQKGNITYNTRKVGEERIDADGYTYIKIAEPNKWALKHRYLYEKQNGIIPKGYTVIFADGDKQNFDLDNLILVSRGELLILNNKKLIKNNKELTKVGVNIAKLYLKASKRGK